MPGPDWVGTCPDCGGDLYDPEPWHAHDREPVCDTCERGEESENEWQALTDLADDATPNLTQSKELG